jgi:hypothetical protein
MSYSNYQRIKRVLNFYYSRGTNKESANTVYRKIIKQKLEK